MQGGVGKEEKGVGVGLALICKWEFLTEKMMLMWLVFFSFQIGYLSNFKI